MNAIEEAYDQRAASRKRLLDLKQQLVDKQRWREQYDKEIQETIAGIAREKSRLVDLTQRVCQLLNADVSGVTGERSSVPPQQQSPAQLTEGVAP